MARLPRRDGDHNPEGEKDSVDMIVVAENVGKVHTMSNSKLLNEF